MSDSWISQRSFLRLKLAFIVSGILIVPFVLSVLLASQDVEKLVDKVDYPVQIEQEITESNATSLLQRAEDTNDILLLDKIAWCSTQKEVKRAAENLIDHYVKDISSKLFLNYGENIEVPQGTILLETGLSILDTRSFYGIAEVLSPKKFPKGMSFVIGRHVVTSEMGILKYVPYAVIVDCIADPKEYNINLEVSFGIGTRDVVPRTANLKFRVKENKRRYSEEDIFAMYAFASLLYRRGLDSLKSNKELLDKIIEKQDFAAMRFLGDSIKNKQNKVRRQGIQVDALKAYLSLLAQSRLHGKKVSLASGQCLKIMLEKWSDWIEKRNEVSDNAK